MKRILTIVAVIATICSNAQAFKGKGDNKLQVGANIQSGGQGLTASYDLGIGENISVGLQGVFLLNTPNKYLTVDSNNPSVIMEEKPDFLDKTDLRARFNANLCNVIGIDKLDVYPGLSVGLRNLGGHLGARYFFTDGFGVYTEFAQPLASYASSKKTILDYYNNQFTFSLGMTFNL